jgi:adenylylsulfate kinase
VRGSGKSTVAYTLEHALFQKGKVAQVLDGRVLNPKP